MSKRSMTRRSFIHAGALAAGAMSIVPRHVLGGQGFTPPSEQLTKAVIGVGGMGRGHLKTVNPTSRLLAVCDVDENHLKEALKQSGSEDVKGYKDFREVLARPDIDVVHIPTPPHWHALIAIAAAEAGKDIWCEKPLSRTIAEGQAVVAAVQRHARVFRLNTWFRFEGQFYDFGSTVKPVKKLVNSGMLGWPLKATVGAATGFAWKLDTWKGRLNLKPQEVPKGLDYDMWLGPAPYKPYHPHRVHGSFRGYWDYDGGGLGDMGQHYLDPVQYVLGKDDTSPIEVEADTPPQHYDAVIPWRTVRLKYADGCEIILDGDDNPNREVPFLEGPNGKLFKGFRCTIPDIQGKLASFPEPEPLVTDFVKAVKNRQAFALNESNGHRSCTIINIAKIAVQLGRPLRFDPVAQRFINDRQANRLVDQPMRGHWHL
jgi:predicted dehydrogenase